MESMAEVSFCSFFFELFCEKDLFPNTFSDNITFYIECLTVCWLRSVLGRKLEVWKPIQKERRGKKKTPAGGRRHDPRIISKSFLAPCCPRQGWGLGTVSRWSRGLIIWSPLLILSQTCCIWGTASFWNTGRQDGHRECLLERSVIPPPGIRYKNQNHFRNAGAVFYFFPVAAVLTALNCCPCRGSGSLGCIMNPVAFSSTA